MNRLKGNKNKNKLNSTNAPNTTDKQKRTYFNPYTTNPANRTSINSVGSSETKTYTRQNTATNNKTTNSKTTNNKTTSGKKKTKPKSSLLNRTKSKGQTPKTQIPKAPSYTSSSYHSENSNYSSYSDVHKKVSPNGYSSGNKTTNPYQTNKKKSSKVSNSNTKGQKARLKRRKQMMNWAKIAGIVATTTFVIWGGVGVVESMNRPKIIYQTVKEGSIDNSKKLKGVILRSEEVISEELKDNVKLLVTEGEKVKKDGQTYVIGDAAELKDSIEVQEQIDKQIYNKAEEREDISYYQDDISNINEAMENDFAMFYDNINQDSTRFVYNLRSKLEGSISNKTNIYTQEQSDKQNNIAKEKAEIEEAISKNSIVKTAPRSGIISYYIDGSETLYATDKIEDIDYNKYNDFAKGASKVDENALYKIIFDNKWYIVTYTDKGYDDDFAMGETYQLWFNHNNKQVPFKLTSKEIENDKNLKLVFETSDQIGGFLDVRNVEFAIGDKDVRGIKIPKPAIVEQNMIQIPVSYTTNKDSKYGVYRKNGEASEYVELEVRYRIEDHLYVRQDITDKNIIQINDVLVEPVTANTYTLKDIKTDQGVYVANGNVAEFKIVTPIHFTTDYAIIDPEGRTQLKVGDRIITNPKSIEMDQLIKK